MWDSFFFSSRRRHTRLTCDWSSDVCSSDLGRHAAGVGWGLAAGAGFGLFFIGLDRAGSGSDLWPITISQVAAMVTVIGVAVVTRDLALPRADRKSVV